MKNMRIIIISLIFLQFVTVSAQFSDKDFKLIPDMSLKIGSQTPTVGTQFTLSAGIMQYENFFTGIGFGYASNMGMGGATFPLFLDARYYFNTKKGFLFTQKDKQNNFQIDVQMGMSINPDKVWKTGFLAGIGFGYRFDFLQINNFKIFPFYLGFNIEYNHSKYFDEYLGFTIKDGYLTHTMLNLKVIFEIGTFKLSDKEKTHD